MFFISYTLLASLPLGLGLPSGVVDIQVEWRNFQAGSVKCCKNPKELVLRKMIFTRNLKEISKHNAEYEAGKSSYKEGVNVFTDRTEEERKRLLGFIATPSRFLQENNVHKVDVFSINDSEIPVSIDYRKLGAVTSVKDQGDCGSCWAFSAVGSIESTYFFATKKLVSFSEQQLIDCSKQNSACDGGIMIWAFQDLQKIGGITSSQSYIYTATDERCKFNKTLAVAQIKGYKTFDKSALSLKKAVAEFGPISVGIEVTNTFFAYQTGVFSDDTCEGLLNHGVLIVGYGSENGTDYWIVKNSWGSDWGEGGYIRLNSDKKNCVHPSELSVPIVKPIA